MLITLAALGFGLAALSYSGLAVLLTLRGAPNATGRLFIGALAAQAVWGAAITAAMLGFTFPIVLIGAVEAARLFLWIAFLLALVRSGRRPGIEDPLLARTASAGMVAAATIAAGALAIDLFAFGEQPAFIVRVIAAVFALVCLEQVYRNTPTSARWAVKFMAVALLALFGFDLVMYSEALLFSRLNPALWSARGFANALLVPMLAIAAARNRNWKLEIAVSREVVFHTTTLLAAGSYLLLVAAGGYWVRYFGGDWGGVVQALMVFIALVAVLVMLLSGTLRARLRVFLAKHFFSYRYDYRSEWLKLTQLLAETPGAGATGVEPEPLEVRALKGLGALVESAGGALWMSNDDAQFVCAARWRFDAAAPALADAHPMTQFLKTRHWVISLPEWREQPDRYDHLELPAFVTSHDDNWLVVPLMLHDDLLGFVVLKRPLAPTEVDWEVRDALKTAARQVASYLGVRRAVESLVQARQFESFNRMSAFVVHDLKNLVAQLSLLLANAERHRDNPEFQQDMLETIGNVQVRMQGLLMQLRAGTKPIELPSPVPLAELVGNAIRSKRVEAPGVELTIDPSLSSTSVLAHRDRLERVIGHLIQNAAEASPRNGRIAVRVVAGAQRVTIEVQDHGKGMSEQFIRERLFKPFQSTKNHGMGIGTFESREYVRELGGSLEVESQENAGTTFRIRLPMAVSVATT